MKMTETKTEQHSLLADLDHTVRDVACSEAPRPSPYGEVVADIQVIDPRHKYSPDTSEISFAYGRIAKEHEIIDYTYRKVRINENQRVYLENRGIVTLRDGFEFVKGDTKNTSITLTHEHLGTIHYRKAIPSSAFRQLTEGVFKWDIDYDWETSIPAPAIMSSPLYEYTLRLSFFAREKGKKMKRYSLIVSSSKSNLAQAPSHSKKISCLKMLWGCLAEGTLVTMADESLKPIEEVRAGDLVMNMYGLPLQVTNTYLGEEDELYVVRTEAGHEIMATLTHPFLTEKGMLPLSSLKLMDSIELGSGQTAKLSQCFPIPYAEKVYNLETEDGQAFIGNGFVVGDFSAQNSYKNKRSDEPTSAKSEVIPPSDEFCYKALISSRQDYDELYRRSIKDPVSFWAEAADSYIDWYEKWESVEDYNFTGESPYVHYFQGAKLNVAYNCLDRHIQGYRRNKAALIWQGEPVEEAETYTYQRLHREVNKAASMLKNLGVTRGDRVALYLPMIPELVISMLACARIGAVHCVVFGGLSAESLCNRIQDSGAVLVVTANYGYRSGKILDIKGNCDKAIEHCPSIKACVVVKRIDKRTKMIPGRDIWWDDQIATADPYCEPTIMDAEDPLFILYTSGSTARPKGIVHTSGGYLLYTSMTTQLVFDMKDEDVYWCTADVGWITGHSYLVYGPLSIGATVMMFEGVPNYPSPDRYWEIVEKFSVSILYTSPTAIRAMIKDGDKWPQAKDLSSLRLLASVGEPINPKAWKWYYDIIGKKRCPVADTWWQTETGGILITSIPGAIDMKPGSATLPFFGIQPKILRNDNSEAEINEGGRLVITRPWPGMMRGVYGNGQVFKNTYFSEDGYYLTGDGASKDEDGYYWLLGRIDDVIMVSAHRIGTAEVESALASHQKVAEAAVVGVAHDIKGESIYAYVILKEGEVATHDLRKELIAHVRSSIGPIATPEVIHFAKALPKTRSGKIMRRILRKIAAQEPENLGDTSTLADPTVISDLLKGVNRAS